MSMLGGVCSADLSAAKNVFMGAIRFATTIEEGSCASFGDELKLSAQEQVDYMIREDADTSLITDSEEVVLEVKKGLSKLSSAFEKEVSLLRLESINLPDNAEKKILECLTDLEWMWNVLQKMDLTKEFIFLWAQISDNTIAAVVDEKFGSDMWRLKLKLIEVTSKILDAVGYGNVAIPSPFRVQLLNTWLPYISKIKPLLDSAAVARNDFAYKMDEDLCQNIEGAITSLLLALPSNNQADILADWMMSTEQLSYPDLSEAFEIWCYRTKSAKRRLLEGVSNDNAADTSVLLLPDSDQAFTKLKSIYISPNMESILNGDSDVRVWNASIVLSLRLAKHGVGYHVNRDQKEMSICSSECLCMSLGRIFDGVSEQRNLFNLAGGPIEVGNGILFFHWKIRYSNLTRNWIDTHSHPTCIFKEMIRWDPGIIHPGK